MYFLGWAENISYKSILDFQVDKAFKHELAITDDLRDSNSMKEIL